MQQIHDNHSKSYHWHYFQWAFWKGMWLWDPSTCKYSCTSLHVVEQPSCLIWAFASINTKKWRHPSLSLCLSYCSLFGVCFCALRFGHDLFGRSYSPHAFLTCKVSRTKWCVYGALLPKLSAMFSSHGCQQCVTGKVWYCTHSPRGLCNDTVFHDVHLGMVWFNLWNSMHITWGQSSGTHTHYFIHIVYIYIYTYIYIYDLSYRMYDAWSIIRHLSFTSW